MFIYASSVYGWNMSYYSMNMNNGQTGPVNESANFPNETDKTPEIVNTQKSNYHPKLLTLLCVLI
ncbi:MAG TPA: hypothetical protein VFD00_04410 [Thermoclostridium sp.]|nr:hypothetical protein [Thermoclostridium sp.]